MPDTRRSRKVFRSGLRRGQSFLAWNSSICLRFAGVCLGKPPRAPDHEETPCATLWPFRQPKDKWIVHPAARGEDPALPATNELRSAAVADWRDHRSSRPSRTSVSHHWTFPGGYASGQGREVIPPNGDFCFRSARVESQAGTNPHTHRINVS